MDSDYGKRIKGRRLALKMTQKELGEACGLTESAICHFERGSRSPSFSSIVKLSYGLKWSVEDITGINLFAAPRLLEMLEGMQHLSEEQKEFLLKVYEYLKEQEDHRLASSQGIHPSVPTQVSDVDVV